MKALKTAQKEFLESAEHRRLFEQEKLLIEVTELLSEVMEKKRISRAQLAAKIGKSKAFVTQLLRGNHNMTLRTIADLFDALEHQVCLKAQPRDEEQQGFDAVAQKAWSYYYSRVGEILVSNAQGTLCPKREKFGQVSTWYQNTDSTTPVDIAA